ncbi:hypothetical protein ACFL2H_01970 [Planctomycetota bacterium]
MSKKNTFFAMAIAFALACNAHGVLVIDSEISSQTLPGGGGGSSALGAVGSVVDVDFTLDLPFGAGPVGLLGAGSSLTTSVGSLAFVDGFVSVKDSGTDDLVEFAIIVNNQNGGVGSSGDGQITFSFSGDLVSSTAIDAALIAGLVGETSTITYNDFSNTQLSNYSGVVQGVTAVPEASSVACMSVIGLGFIGWRQRKRFLRK